MAAPRKPRAPRRSRAPRSTGAWATTAGGVGGGELVQAAEEIADGARANASWSRSIPSNIRTVEHDEMHVDVVADTGAAYPAETRARHPLFGNRRHWYGPPGEPFLAPAAEERAGTAMEKFAVIIDRIAADRGFK